MKKNLFYLTAMAAMLASCASEEMSEGQVEKGLCPIEFRGDPGMMTRATGADAASLLSNRFTVYGVKKTGNTLEAVFNGVPVNYVTEWDYTSVTEPSRYWDPNANSYKFMAYSDANATNVVVAPVIKSGADVSDIPTSITIGSTTSNVTLDQLQKVYVASSKEVSQSAFTSPVQFQFVNAAAKVRVAFFNAIPGYDVILDQFYPASPAVDANKTKNVTFFNDNGFYTAAAYSVDLSNATTSLIGTPTTASVFTLGDECTKGALGKSITAASFDKTAKAWTWAMPVNGAAKDLNLEIKYTLHSAHESIQRTSFVTIPAIYAQWKANHAYTYYFRITDNDLHPITFSAEVIDFETNEQETITTIDGEQEANITTWVDGSTVQVTPVYKVGDKIGVSVTNAGANFAIQWAYTSDLTVDGSNAGSKIADSSYTTIYHDSEGRAYFIADKGAGKYVIKVSYTDSQSNAKVAYKVVTVNN